MPYAIHKPTDKYNEYFIVYIDQNKPETITDEYIVHKDGYTKYWYDYDLCNEVCKNLNYYKIGIEKHIHIEHEPAYWKPLTSEDAYEVRVKDSITRKLVCITEFAKHGYTYEECLAISTGNTFLVNTQVDVWHNFLGTMFELGIWVVKG